MRKTVEDSFHVLFGSRTDLRAPGIHVVPGIADYRGVYFLRLGDGLTISAPDDVSLDVEGLEPDEAFTREAAARLVGARAGLVLGPSVHAYASRECFVRQEPCQATRVHDADGFDEVVPEAEWSEGGFHEGDGIWYACFEGDERVAMGNMTNFNGTNGDVGLVTRPDMRGRGYGVRLAGAMIEDAFASGLDVVRYRALASNSASRRVCRKLGFVDDGANLAVRLID